MEEYLVQRPLRRPPIHPGEVVREDVLPALGLSVSEAARRLGVSRQQLHRILACTHPITTEMALRIGRLAGNGPGLWLCMQQAHDLWHAEQRLKEELAQIAPGIVTGSSQADAGRALVTFLSSPASQTVLKAKGFE
jgi:addiction module HigA family antidote